MVSKRTEELIKWDQEHIIHPHCPVGHNVGLVFERGHGIMLQDTEGKEYIDCSSQLVNLNLGHGRKEIINAVLEQMNKLEFAHVFAGVSNAASIECSQKLAEITPEGLDHFHFTSGGSESTETALRIARLYWHNQGKNKFKIISLFDAYHGPSGGVVEATSLAKGLFWRGFGPPAPGFVHMPSYYCYRCVFDLEYPGCDIRCAQYLAKVIENEGADSVAAFMAEPVQGAAGQISPPPEYWPIIKKICDDYDVLLIGDEVMSGFTRTGKMFGMQHWNVKQDIMPMAKGITSGYIPFGAVAINDRVYEGLKDRPFAHGHTYSGHPVGAAASVATIDIYIREKIADNAAKVGRHVLERLEAEFKSLPCVGNFTGLGLMIGVEIVTDKATKAVPDPAIMNQWRMQVWERGLYFRWPAGTYGSRIFICPPCITTVEEADRILDNLLPTVAAIKPS